MKGVFPCFLIITMILMRMILMGTIRIGSRLYQHLPDLADRGRASKVSSDSRPSGPPPSYVPQQSTYAIDPGGIRGCLYRFTYIRLENGRRFWFYPVFVGRRSIAGYRWRPRQYRWQYFGIDLDEVSSFSCH